MTEDDPEPDHVIWDSMGMIAMYSPCSSGMFKLGTYRVSRDGAVLQNVVSNLGAKTQRPFI